MPFNRLDHHALGEIRPRFSLKIDCEAEDALEYVSKLMIQDTSVSGYRSDQLLFVKTPSWLSHYWSPEMTVRIEKEEFVDFTVVSCVIGPRQSVWAMFIMIYAALAIITVFGGIFGLVEYQQSGHSPWLWCLPIGTVLFLSAFITSNMGQRKGRDQMLHLVSFIYHSLDDITTVERYDRR
ncbi:MAG: hypothetical protein EP338_05065 [Bacteroidetes bacterium]|nr:MAG: hypothetical protein EP338_05065 [Bacteroidota bacterium]